MHPTRTALRNYGANNLMTEQLGHAVDLAVTAAGADQSTATVLPACNQTVIVTTVGSGEGVMLPSVDSSHFVLIRNTGANTLNVYPAPGEAINTGAVNTGTTINSNAFSIFFGTRISGTGRWARVS